jgi:hypothetical protein
MKALRGAAMLDAAWRKAPAERQQRIFLPFFSKHNREVREGSASTGRDLMR